MRVPYVVFRPLRDPAATVELVVAWRPENASPIVTSFIEVAKTANRAAEAPPKT